MGHCWRMQESNRAARKKTKKANRETESRQAFSSNKTMKWYCLTYNVNETSGRFCYCFICVCVFKEKGTHETFLFKSTYYKKE